MNISHVLFFSVTVLLIERAGGRKGLYMEYNEETEERGLRRLSVFHTLQNTRIGDLAMHDTIWYPGAQNIFFTLTAGLFAIYAMDSRGPIGRWKVEIALAAALLAEFLRFDYGMAGVGIIVMFYLIEKERSGADAYTLAYFNKKQNIEIVVLSSLVYILCLGMNQLYALLAMIPVNMYSGERGRMKLKYFFYLFYPLHLLLIWFIWKRNVF